MCDFALQKYRGTAISRIPVVTEITAPMEITISTKLKMVVVAILLIASAPVAFAQRAPADRGNATSTYQDSGPFEHMSRPE